MSEIEKQKSLINLAKKVIAKHDVIAKATGEKFNMFSVIDVHKKELQHSRFIAELLNPKGRHSQGYIFLKLFLNTINEDAVLNKKGFKLDFKTSNAIVYLAIKI